MQSFEDPQAFSRWSRAARARGESIAFVPTMGFLHEGHISLLRAGRERADHLVASIFVNPLQFGPGEDLGRYPRDPEGDAEKCRSCGVDQIFLPTPKSMYPAGFQTTIRLGPLAERLCGSSRPGHFEGMATVVLKLLNLARPTVALFGRKDFQQLAIIRRLARDLDLDVDIVGMPIVREGDGLALSSRNKYLSVEQRRQALVLSRSLAEAAEAFTAGERDPVSLLSAVRALITEQPLASLDYADLVDAEDLSPLTGPIERPALLALAVRFGGTRLIDNRLLRP